MQGEVERPLVIVTGAAGLIGRRIIDQLSAHYTMAALDIADIEYLPNSAKFFHCDLTDDNSVSTTLADVRAWRGDRVASVIHLAAYYDFAGKESPLYHDLTVLGTQRLLRELRKFNRVDQFVFSSSLLAMKSCKEGERLTEASPTHAEWRYPESKLEAEQVIKNERGKIPSVILRIAGVYDEQGHSLPICQNIRRIAEKELESYFFPGDADRGQSFVHLDDLVRSFELVVERRAELDDVEVFLIAERECLSYETLQDIIGRELHGAADWPTIQIPKFVAKAGAWTKDKLASSHEDRPFIKPWMVDMADAHYPVDHTHATERLGWQPEHRLSQTLPQMIARLKDDPEAWYQQNKLPLPDSKKTLEAIAASHHA